MTLIWQLAPGSQLAWHCWGDECLLYNDSSGATHLLGVAVAELLRSLENNPQTTLQLEGNLSELWDGASSKMLFEWLDETLFQLKSLGLVDIKS